MQNNQGLSKGYKAQSRPVLDITKTSSSKLIIIAQSNENNRCPVLEGKWV